MLKKTKVKSRAAPRVPRLTEALTAEPGNRDTVEFDVPLLGAAIVV